MGTRLYVSMAVMLLMLLAALTTATMMAGQASDVIGVGNNVTLLPPKSELQAFIHKKIQEMKLNLTKTVLQSSVRRKRDYQGLQVTWSDPWSSRIEAQVLATFQYGGYAFLAADVSILRFTEYDVTSTELEEAYHLTNVVDQFSFIRTTEYGGVLFVLACYPRGYCQIHSVTNEDSSSRMTLVQTIKSFGYTRAAEFFQQSGDCFLILVNDKQGHEIVPSYIYKWIGTHFDEVYSEMTADVQAAATLRVPTGTIVIVAQGYKENPLIGSKVFHLGEDHVFTRVQLLITHNVAALQPFSLRNKHFLFVASRTEQSTIYWWSGDEFVEWALVPELTGNIRLTAGIVKDETIVIAAKANEMFVYTFDESGLFRKVATILLDDYDEVVELNLFSDEYGDPFVFFVSLKSSIRYTGMVKLTLKKTPTDGKVDVLDPMLQCMVNLGQGLKNREEDLEEMLDSSENLILLDEDLKIESDFKVGEELVFAGEKADIGYVDIDFDVNLVTTSSLLKQDILSKIAIVETLKNSMDDYVLRSSEGYIAGRLEIKGDLVVDKAIIEKLNVETLNGWDLNLENVLMYKGNQTLTGSVTAEELLVDETVLLGKLAGYNVEDLLLSEGNQEISGYHKLATLEVDSMSLEDGMINNVRLEDFVTRNFKGIVTGRKDVEKLYVEDLTVDSLNMYNFNDWMKSLVETDQKVCSLGDVTVNSNAAIGRLDTKYLNGHSVEEMFKDIIKKDGENIVEGDVAWDKVSVRNLTVLKSLNGSHPSEWLTTTTDQEVSTDLEVKTLTVDGDVNSNEVNGLDISEDAVVTTGNVVISGPITMTSMRVLKNISAESGITVDGVDVSEAGMRKLVQVYTGKVKVEGGAQAGSMHLDTTKVTVSSGKNLMIDESLASKFWSKTRDRVVTNDVVFQGPVSATSVVAESVNYLNIKEDLMTTASDQLVKCDMIFEDVKVDEITAEDGVTFEGYDLSSLKEYAICEEGTYKMSGKKTFDGGIEADEVWVNNVNDIDVNKHLVSLKGDKVVGGNKHFNSLDIRGDLKASEIEIEKYNNIDLEDVLSNAVPIDEPAVIKGAVTFKDDVVADYVETKELNGMDLSALFDSLLYKDSAADLKELTVEGDVLIKSNIEPETVNDLYIKAYLNDVVDRTTDSEIDGKVTVEGHLEVEELDASEINGYSLQKLGENLFLRSKEQVVTGSYEFNSVNADEVTVDLINGYDIEKDLVFINDEETSVSTGVRFKDLYVGGDVKVELLNGCDVGEVFQGLEEIAGDRQFKSVLIEGDLNWKESHPENELLSYLFSSAVTKHDEQTISGDVVVGGPAVTKNVLTKEYINGVDLKAIIEDALLKTGDQTIGGRYNFTNGFSASHITVHGNADIDEINGVDVLLLNSTLVRRHEKSVVKGDKTFEEGLSAGSLSVKGTIDGVALSSIVTTNTEERIPRTDFGYLEIIDDLIVDTVDGEKLQTYLEGRVTLSGKQDVHSDLTFESAQINDLKTTAINEINISELVYAESDDVQRIVGKIVFSEDLEIDGNLACETVNGWNLKEIADLAIRVDEDVDIDGDVILLEETAMNTNIDVYNLVNGIDIGSLPETLGKKLPEDVIDGEIKDYKNAVDDMYRNALNLAQGTATEFLYVERGLTSLPSAYKVEPLATDELIRLNIYGHEAGDACGLPRSCPCPRQHVMDYNGDYKPPTVTQLNRGLRKFDLYANKEGMEFAATVHSTSVSSSPECALPKNRARIEYTAITAMRINDHSGKQKANVDVEEHALLGYLTDTVSFISGNSLVIVAAIGYSTEEESYNVDSYVLEFNSNSQPRVLQKIRTYGVTGLSLLECSSGATHLAISNFYDSRKDSCAVFSEIYEFDEKRKRFSLLREVETIGAVDVESVAVPGADFLVFAQQPKLNRTEKLHGYSEPILILKYDSEYNNYYFYQSLLTSGAATGLGVFYVEGTYSREAYLTVAVEGGHVYIYQYAYVEGFREVMKIAKSNAYNVVPFNAVGHQYLFVASEDYSEIWKVISRGTKTSY